MNPLLVALDVDTGSHALRLADELRGAVGGFKVGSRLFTAEGPSVVRALVERGDRVFLDLKFHDIPSTVAGAAAAAAELGVWMVNVHASGGGAMMRAAREAAIQAAGRRGLHPPLVIAVTVLTSLAADALAEIGLSGVTPAELVVRLATLARNAGLDGVVASPQETAVLRQTCGPAFTIVTPGIRGGTADAGADDQRRTLAPLEAIRAGASYLVVGRPVTAAPRPRAVAERIGEELGLGADDRPVVTATLTLYTRRACHLCDEMKAIVREVAGHEAIRMTEVDVDADPALAREYGYDVPVLFLDGREIARHRLTPARLIDELRRRAGQKAR